MPSLAVSIDSLVMFRNQTFLQDSEAPPVNETGAFFSFRAEYPDNAPFTSGSLQLPDGSTRVLSPTPQSALEFNSPFLPSLVSLNTEFGVGGYYAALEASGTAVGATLEYTADNYTAFTPHLVGGNYSALQGMDSTLDFGFSWNGFADALPDSFVFISVWTTDDVPLQKWSSDFISSGVVSAVMPALTLDPDSSYFFELIFSQRSFVATAGTNFDSLMSFDSRTRGYFNTAPAIPEPGTWALMALGLVAVGAVAKRRR